MSAFSLPVQMLPVRRVSQSFTAMSVTAMSFTAMLFNVVLFSGLLLVGIVGCAPSPIIVPDPDLPAPDGTLPPLPEDLDAVVAAPARHPIQEHVFYFVMPDRFANGDPENDTGGLDGTRLDHGFDPTSKGFFHGGDLAGLIKQLDYLEGLGVSAVWMTPVFQNRPVQGSGENISAGYHGYWITDFTQFDPHFGTNAELEQLIEAAHARGIRIFFDIITNHTADIIAYAEGEYSYRPKDAHPYSDADGNVFDDRDFADQAYGDGAATFPPLDVETSFPYTPVFNIPADSSIKVPGWLNDPRFYHNRGDSTFSGENSLYGDFFGLDDLFTERPDVVQGMIDIYTFWVENYAIDGFRIDTVKHVNVEFWEHFSPAILAAAHGADRPDFFFFGEVYSADARLLSFYPTSTAMPAVLDFRFQEAVRGYVSQGGSSDWLRLFFEADDLFTDRDSSAAMLPVFIGNHDMGRIGWFLAVDNDGTLSDSEMLARSELAHALMYFARGVPVIYYGDEQGFVGDGGDQDARQNMFPSQVASYNDDDLIGTDAGVADDNFDPEHPLYRSLSEFAALYRAHDALRHGAQIHRHSSDGPGIYAFSRMDRAERVEYVVAVNNTNAPQSATFATASPDTLFRPIYPNAEMMAEGTVESGGDGVITVEVDGWGITILRADAPLPESETAPAISIAGLEDGQRVPQQIDTIDGNRVPQRLEVRAQVDSPTAIPAFVEVTFAVRESGTVSYTIIGTDDNPPYRVFHDISDYGAGTELDFLAVVNDLNGHLRADAVTGIRPVPPEETDDPEYDRAVIHYQRADGDYGDPDTDDFNDFWGLHLWGDAIDPSEVTEWTAPKPFAGSDAYGRFAEIELRDSSQDVNFIVHRGDLKDGTQQDRRFNPAADGPEIWLKQDDPAFYTSQAAAQGFVTIHYHRDDGDYGDPDSSDFGDFWGLHLWGDAIAPDVATEWTAPRPPDGTDAFGLYWTVPIVDAGQPVNFIVHRGDQKDPGPDQQMDPQTGADAYVVSGHNTVYDTVDETGEVR